MALDIDQILLHGVRAGKLTERQARIAKKIYQGQRLIKTEFELMRLDDETVVTQEDLDVFQEHNLAGLLVHGAALNKATKLPGEKQ